MLDTSLLESRRSTQLTTRCLSTVRSVVALGISVALCMLFVFNFHPTLSATSPLTLLSVTLTGLWSPHVQPLVEPRAAAEPGPAMGMQSMSLLDPRLLLAQAFAECVRWWKHHSFAVVLAGLLMLMVVFFVDGYSTGLKGYISIAIHFRFPAPRFFGSAAMVSVVLGPLLILGGEISGFAWATIAGAKLLTVFLVVTSYVGHCRPLATARGVDRAAHKQNLAKNISVIGGLTALVGYKLRELKL